MTKVDKRQKKSKKPTVPAWAVWLRSVREAKGLSLQDLAARFAPVPCSVWLLHQTEHGRRILSPVEWDRWRTLTGADTAPVKVPRLSAAEAELRDQQGTRLRDGRQKAAATAASPLASLSAADLGKDWVRTTRIKLGLSEGEVANRICLQGFWANTLIEIEMGARLFTREEFDRWLRALGNPVPPDGIGVMINHPVTNGGAQDAVPGAAVTPGTKENALADRVVVFLNANIQKTFTPAEVLAALGLPVSPNSWVFSKLAERHKIRRVEAGKYRGMGHVQAAPMAPRPAPALPAEGTKAYRDLVGRVKAGILQGATPYQAFHGLCPDLPAGILMEALDGIWRKLRNDPDLVRANQPQADLAQPAPFEPTLSGAEESAGATAPTAARDDRDRAIEVACEILRNPRLFEEDVRRLVDGLRQGVIATFASSLPNL
jgi:transcriptional regulator with XRE-family HTH domain